MNPSNRVYRRHCTLFIVLGFIVSTTCFANHSSGGFGSFGGGYYHQGNIGGYYHHDGGYHQGIYNNQYYGYHHYNNYNYNGVGNYYPENGWVAPAVVIDPSVDTTVYDNNCQTIQQCDDNGTCILTQDCE